MRQRKKNESITMTTMLKERSRVVMSHPMSTALNGARYMRLGSAVSGTWEMVATSIVVSIMMMTSATGIIMDNTVTIHNESERNSNEKVYVPTGEL